MSATETLPAPAAMAPAEVSRRIWDSRYRHRPAGGPPEAGLAATWRRVAGAVAAAEPRDRDLWEDRFLAILRGFRFLPGGRILAGAGTGREVTLCNCFVMGTIEDSLSGIFTALEEGALTMQQGGGVGYDFSTLRPAGTAARRTGAVASGPVPFLRLFDAMCATLLSTGARRGAMMATLRSDHPDVLAFVDAKRAPGALPSFNLSVQVTDDLLAAVEADRPWPLVFPAAAFDGDEPAATVMRRWPGTDAPVPCRVVGELPARLLWRRMAASAHRGGEPGLLFVDRINRLSNLAYREHVTATNPCGEVPLPPYGACNLGSLELTRFVRRPFAAGAELDLAALGRVAGTAVRFLDDVLDVTGFPLAAQRREARATRRIGLGVTGLADALVLLGRRYGSPASLDLAAAAMREIALAAYRASIELAREKGPFPAFDRDRFLAGERVRTLPADVRRGIAEHGLRNGQLTAVAPTGTISLLAGNVSSGLEPIVGAEVVRRVRGADGTAGELRLADPASAAWRERGGSGLPPAFVRAEEVTPEEHLAMQAALQPWVDQAISKTIALPEQAAPEAVAAIFARAAELGLKGVTVYRHGATPGAVIAAAGEVTPADRETHCCSLDREGD